MSSHIGLPQGLPARVNIRMPVLKRGWSPKWHLLYFALAAFDVFAVCAGLYVSHSIMAIYRDSAVVNQTWADRINAYSQLGELAAEVNAPGNDVFKSRDIEREARRMREAKRAFDQEFGILRLELLANLEPAQAAPIVAKLDAVSSATAAMAAQARLTFAALRAQEADRAGERMATMDAKYADVNVALRGLRESISAIQQRSFDEQIAAAASLRTYEWLIGALIFLMVAGATLYGLRLARQIQSDAAEKERHLREIGEAHGLLQETTRRLQALFKRTLEGQEKQRQDVAHELHEDVAQMLSALKLRLGSPQIEHADAIAQGAINRLGELVRELTPHGMDSIGLAEVLRSHLREWSSGKSLIVRFSDRLDGFRPPFHIETAAYRIVEEAVGNAVRHAGARTVRVDLRQSAGQLCLTVADDGRGFDVDAARQRAAATNRLGITLMEQRSVLLGGTLRISSNPGHGTTVEAILPALPLPATR